MFFLAFSVSLEIPSYTTNSEYSTKPLIVLKNSQIFVCSEHAAPSTCIFFILLPVQTPFKIPKKI